MITKIEINGFKTFENFSMVFSPFIVVAGANGSGKSNLFDAIRLLSALVEKDLKTAFSEQRGSFMELFTQHSATDVIDEMQIAVELFLDKSVRDDFNKEEELGHRRLRYEIHISRRKDSIHGLEKIFVEHEALKPIKRGQDKWYKEVITDIEWESEKKSLNYKAYINTEIKNDVKVISLRQDGIRGGKATPVKDLERTVLSGLNDASFPHAYAVRKEMLNWKIFQLSPIELSKPSPMLGSDILDIEGRNLAALIKRIAVVEPMALQSISRNVHKILPEIREIYIDDDAIRQQYVLMVKSIDGRIFSSNVLSEGTLRIIALIALYHDERHRGLICFEEPENGIHPYRMKKILQVLDSLATDFSDKEDAALPLRQVFVNTHSPLIIKEVIKYFNDNKHIVYFSRLVNKVDAIKGISYKITRLSAVKNENTMRFFIDSIPAEDTVTHYELEEYLNTFDNDVNS